METVCPYCGEEIWFEDDVWDDMLDGGTLSECARGICPECGADCCYTCPHVYIVGREPDIRIPQIRQRERLLQNPNYPF